MLSDQLPKIPPDLCIYQVSTAVDSLWCNPSIPAIPPGCANTRETQLSSKDYVARIVLPSMEVDNDNGLLSRIASGDVLEA